MSNTLVSHAEQNHIWNCLVLYSLNDRKIPFSIVKAAVVLFFGLYAFVHTNCLEQMALEMRIMMNLHCRLFT